MNIPGEAGSIVNCLDGHAMAKQGRAGAALGVAALGSFFAGCVGTVFSRHSARRLRPSPRNSTLPITFH